MFQTDTREGLSQLQVKAVESGFYRCVGTNSERLTDTSAFKHFYVTGTTYIVLKKIHPEKSLSPYTELIIAQGYVVVFSALHAVITVIHITLLPCRYKWRVRIRGFDWRFVCDWWRCCDDGMSGACANLRTTSAHLERSNRCTHQYESSYRLLPRVKQHSQSHAIICS